MPCMDPMGIEHPNPLKFLLDRTQSTHFSEKRGRKVEKRNLLGRKKLQALSFVQNW